jgi:signal peptidase I
VALLAIVLAGFVYSFRMARVQGHSMEPTFYTGQWLLVRRLNWPTTPLEVGDVVVLNKDGDQIVKRIVALPGQRPPSQGTMALALAQAAARHEVPSWASKIKILEDPVPEGELYVVGDNLPKSDDSRSFGPVPIGSLIGRVLSFQEKRDEWKRIHRLQGPY